MKDSARLKILICSDYLPPSDGGVENVIARLTEGLVKDDIDVHVFSLIASDHPLVNLPEEVTVHSANAFDFRRYLGVQSKVSLSAIPKLYRLIRSLHPDIIHLHNRFFYTTPLGYLLARVTRFDGTVITTTHLGEITGIAGIAGTVARVYEQTVGRAVFNRSDYVIAVSEASARHAESLGANESTTHVVPNGVDTEVFHPPEQTVEDPRIIFVGRLVENKGPQDLIAALPNVIEEHPDLAVHIVGSGPLEEKLRRQVKRLRIDDQVCFAGRVESVSEEMRKARVFCRPSLTEGLPLTLLEAMATGIPPVVTPVAGVPEVVTDGETGILVPPRDPSALARWLVDLFDQPEKIESLGTAARQYVIDNHRWEHRTEQLIRICRSD